MLSPAQQEEFMGKSSDMLYKALEAAKDNKVFQIQRKNITPGNCAAKLSDLILKNFEDPVVREFASGVTKVLLPIIQLKTNNSKLRGTQCTMLHHCCKNENLQQLWSIITRKHSINDGSALLFNTVLKRLFELSLEWRNETVLKETFTKADVKLSVEEQKTLRYVAGFMPFSLAKRYKIKQDTAVGKAVLETISSWRLNSSDNDKDMNFLEFSKCLTDRVNRGGLFLVKDEYFIFIRRVENVARLTLNCNLSTNYKGEDLRDILMRKLRKSELIDQSWESLSKNIEKDDIRNLLKEIILRKWVGLRTKSFLNCWIRLLKRKQKNISERSESSLRKSLHSLKKANSKS